MGKYVDHGFAIGVTDILSFIIWVLARDGDHSQTDIVLLNHSS